MANNRIIELHQQWIGYLNPIGLVFAPNALEDAQVVINEGVITEQREFLDLVTKTENEEIKYSGYPSVADIFLKTLGWRETDLCADQAFITQYSFSHPQFNEVVSPTYIAKVNEEKVILIQELEQDDFDKTANTEDTWNSSCHFKFERLLREKQVSTGILVSKEKLRLIFAPRGESSGYMDFPFKIMYQPSGRLVFSAFKQLISYTQVFNSSKGQSLIEILELSRKYQAKVSIDLSGQVLAALYELLRGFQTANDDENGELLEKTLKENPQLIYEGLLTTLLRMVFIMYAEDRNLLATDEIYQSSYSLAGLYERLRQDEAQNPDTMDSRYGAWAHLISLFRLIYDGAEYDSEKGKISLPARHGHLFDPSIYLFLEGRNSADEPYSKAPKISDGVVFRVLKNLLVLNGERISYRTLDVEQIGSVYETMMGFEIGIAEGETIALKPAKSHGAPLPINLDAILADKKDKTKKLGEVSELKLSDKVKKEFNDCKTIEALESVLDKRIDRRATPFRLSRGAMVLVPSEARRKSGSHYTPRELTEPIVRKALKPIFDSLGPNPKPEQLLSFKICDPTMGSGAFLVETCRQLSEKLVELWGINKTKINMPSDEDELLFAKRIVAQRCLYGVDKNHMAVNLAKLSLWLSTLSKDQAFSFLDHNLKHGDSLVGLTNSQIMQFDYKDREELPMFSYLKEKVQTVLEARLEIQNAKEENNYDALNVVADSCFSEINPLRLVGNLAIKCFFDGKNDKARDVNIQKHQVAISNIFASGDDSRLKEYCEKNLHGFQASLAPFHWELEFPEVFSSGDYGFDCFVGNPPFLGGTKISGAHGLAYFDWLKTIQPKGNRMDLVGYFFRKVFSLLKRNGTAGLIATNTISQGDTREGGLLPILNEGGQIFDAEPRRVWPGNVSVVVSVIHLIKSQEKIIPHISGKPVRRISAYLFEGDLDTSPNGLEGNPYYALGSKIYGQGFLFSDKDPDSNPLALKEELLKKRPSLGERILPYIGGSELLTSPDQSFHRYVIYLSDITNEAELQKWKELKEIVEAKVKPERDVLADNSNNIPLKRKWWAYQAHRPELYKRMRSMKRVLVCSQVNPQFAFTLSPATWVYSQKAIVFCIESFAGFALIQSSIHFLWAQCFSSTSLELMSYTPSDCFKTFPIPKDFESNKDVEAIGKTYFSFRSDVMKKNKEGLTKTYNRFHDPEEKDQDILNLRKLHEQMDQAVVNLYGWHDLKLEYDFILDYEESEENDDLLSDKKKKKPFRYNLTAEHQEEVIGRLLMLNQERYEEEVRIGLHKR